MSTRNYYISHQAVIDLENIWKYTFDHWSLQQADRYYHLIISEIEYISLHKHVGRPRNDIRQGYRSTKVKSHLIFYRETDDQKIEIVRILHERMDIEERLGE